MTEIYNAYTNLSNLQAHTLAGVLVDISAHESEQGTLMILLPCALHLPLRVVRAHAHTTLTDRRFSHLRVLECVRARVCGHYYCPRSAERDRDAIVNFLELLRATLGGLQQPELALALG